MLMVTSRLTAGYTTRVPSTTTPAVAHGTTVKKVAAIIATEMTGVVRKPNMLNRCRIAILPVKTAGAAAAAAAPYLIGTVLWSSSVFESY
jgi:hypothetical protein